MGVLLLVVGYPIALAVLARLRPVLAERRMWWFFVLEAAMTSIVAGWWSMGQLVGVVVNGAAAVGLGIAWRITASRSRRRRGQEGRSGSSGHR
jgi:hypothetical protein